MGIDNPMFFKIDEEGLKSMIKIFIFWAETESFSVE